MEYVKKTALASEEMTNGTFKETKLLEGAGATALTVGPRGRALSHGILTVKFAPNLLGLAPWYMSGLGRDNRQVHTQGASPRDLRPVQSGPHCMTPEIDKRIARSP